MRHRTIVDGSALRFNALSLDDLPPFADSLVSWIHRPTPAGLRRIHLQGGLGAGKTELARALLRSLGVQGRIKSPSFSIVESYALVAATPPTEAHHLDLFRLSDPEAWRSAGLRDVLASGDLVLIEWPEHARGLPPPDLHIRLEAPEESGRSLLITPGPLWSAGPDFLRDFCSLPTQQETP